MDYHSLHKKKQQLRYIYSSSDRLSYDVLGRGTVEGSEIVIPDTYEGKPVVGVVANAFKDDMSITHLTLGKYISFVGVGNIETLANLVDLRCTAVLNDDYLNTHNGLFTGSGEVGYTTLRESQIFYVLGWIDDDGNPHEGTEANTNVIDAFKRAFADCDNTDDNPYNNFTGIKPVVSV